MKESLGVYLTHTWCVQLFIGGCLFVSSIFLIGQNLDKPFWGEHDWNGVRYGNIARNYLRYGFLETKFGQVENSGYYTHYPPLLPILISISYKLFGIFEWSTRLIPLLATSGIVVMLYLIGSLVWNIKTGILASLLALATPTALYFGKNPVHEPVVLFFILLSFYGYFKKYPPLFLVGLVLAEITAWAGYFILPAITIALVLGKDWSSVKRLLPYWILSITLFSFHFVHVAILTGSIYGGDLINSLLQRSGVLSTAQPQEFTFLGYLDRLRIWFSIQFSLTLTLLTLVWLYLNRTGVRTKYWPITTLGLVGLIYLMVFSNSVFIHNYLTFYFLPFLSLAGSAMILHLRKFKIFKKISLILPVLFLIIVFLERNGYLKALNESNRDKLAVEIGQSIKEQTTDDDVILISPLKYSYSADNFLEFYSDRKLIYSDDVTADYDVLVLVDHERGKFEIIRE
ncbi:MAG: hypothetical protein Q8P92_02220 [Candidatus Daviesbacteria bacterium]|nr:hypothetical protein [Candidatus Daviesbacteria bacterium]